MKIYMEQIPNGVDVDQYPPDTEFAFDERQPTRDIETLELVYPPPRPYITPEEAWKTYHKK